MIRLFGKTYHNWKAKDRPVWQKLNTLKQYGRGVPVGDVAYSVAAIRTGSKPFLWIEAGTQRRYRRMSTDFVPKTRRGYLGSGAGAGSVKGFSRFSLGGIEAREWRFQIAEMRADKFAKEMGSAIERASKGLFVPGPQDT